MLKRGSTGSSESALVKMPHCWKSVPSITFAGSDPEFLERGFICIKVWGLALLILCLFFLNIPWK